MSNDEQVTQPGIFTGPQTSQALLPSPLNSSEQDFSEIRVVDFNYWQVLKYLESIGWTITTTFTPPRQQTPPSILSDSTTGRNSTASSATSPRSPTSNFVPGNSHGGGARPPSVLGPKFRKLLRLPGSSQISPQTPPERPGSTRPDPRQGPTEYNLISSALDFGLTGEVIFLVDNNPTMSIHWPQVQSLLSAIAALTHVHMQADSGIKLFVSQRADGPRNSSQPVGTFNLPQEFTTELEKHHPNFFRSSSNNKSSVGSSSSSSSSSSNLVARVCASVFIKIEELQPRPDQVTLIMFTNGEWNMDAFRLEVKHQIERLLQRKGSDGADEYSSAGGAHGGMIPSGFKMRLVWFGNNTSYLDFPDEWKDIVSVERADGDVSKILLGDAADRRVCPGSTELEGTRIR